MESTSLTRGDRKDFFTSPPTWRVEKGVIPYPDALNTMEAHAHAVFEGTAPELIWLLEHPSLYTLGTSAKTSDILPASVLPTFSTGRGGQVTYHGPGQRIAYLILNLKNRGQDVRAYVRHLEDWIIVTLRLLGLESFRREGRVGIWVMLAGQEKKIAAIGVRVKKWVTLHGISINVNPNLSHYEHIIPCGLPQYGVTSLHQMGMRVSLEEVDRALRSTFDDVFSQCA